MAFVAASAQPVVGSVTQGSALGNVVEADVDLQVVLVDGEVVTGALDDGIHGAKYGVVGPVVGVLGHVEGDGRAVHLDLVAADHEVAVLVIRAVDILGVDADRAIGVVECVGLEVLACGITLASGNLLVAAEFATGALDEDAEHIGLILDVGVAGHVSGHIHVAQDVEAAVVGAVVPVGRAVLAGLALGLDLQLSDFAHAGLPDGSTIGVVQVVTILVVLHLIPAAVMTDGLYHGHVSLVVAIGALGLLGLVIVVERTCGIAEGVVLDIQGRLLEHLAIGEVLTLLQVGDVVGVGSIVGGHHVLVGTQQGVVVDA